MKRIILGALCIALVMILTISSFAYALDPSLTSTTALRNYVANNWSFNSQGYYQNNCLDYALGNTTDWIWPWGGNNPTLTQAENYMVGLNYNYGSFSN